MVKRLLLGTFVLFFWLIAGLTVALPFILTLSVGLGLLPPHSFPFPYRPFQTLLAVSLPLSLLTGLRWIGGVRLERIRFHLQTNAPPLSKRNAPLAGRDNKKGSSTRTRTWNLAVNSLLEGC